MTLLEWLQEEGYVVTRMDREDQRALLVPCACGDNPQVSFTPGCHKVVSGTLTLQGPNQWWLVEESEGFRYVDMASGTVIHAVTAARLEFSQPCDDTKVPLLDAQSALEVALKLAAHHAVNFSKPKGGAFVRVSCCDSCSKLQVRNCLVVLGETPALPGFYLFGHEAARLKRLVCRVGIFCTCSR